MPACDSPCPLIKDPKRPVQQNWDGHQRDASLNSALGRGLVVDIVGNPETASLSISYRSYMYIFYTDKKCFIKFNVD